MYSSVYPHWDIVSVIFYIILAYVGAICLKQAKKQEVAVILTGSKKAQKGKFRLTRSEAYYLLWWFTWVFFAAFRLINSHGIGGTDAWTYINYFINANGVVNREASVVYKFAEHYEIFWRLFTRFVRLFTDNYRIYLIILYGFIVWGYQKFIKSFPIDKVYAAPFITLFFVYLRGFNTIRTNVAAIFILLMIVFLKKDNLKYAVLMGVLAIGTQISSALYCLLIPFYWLYKKNRLKPYLVIILVIASTLVGRFAQSMLTGPLGQMLGHSYSSYAVHNINASFLDNFWKIAFGQLLLAGLLLVFDKKLKARITENSFYSEVGQSIRILRLVCIFDIITIPITFILDIWRGYEILYIVRLMMWSEILYVFLRNKDRTFKYCVLAFTWVAYTAWLVFRIANTWESSGYMPYILNLFGT